MKRIKNSDINFKLNQKLIKISDFNIKFYTVSSGSFFIKKTQDDVVEVEREATMLDWSELKNIGEGVLNYQAINNTLDSDYPDYYYNRRVAQTTEYYIDSDTVIDPDQEESYAERLDDLDNRVSLEVVERNEADASLSGAIESESARAISAETELNEKIDAEITRATSAETDLNISLVNEISRATNKENGLIDLITTLRQDLTDESEVRSSADTSIWNAINGEINRATSVQQKQK